MKYFLNITELKKRKKIIEKKIINNPNIKTSDNVYCDYFRICDLLDKYEVCTSENDDDDNYCLFTFMDKDEILPKEIYDDYSEINSYFKNILFDINNKTDLFEDQNSEVILPKLNINDEELVELGYDLYSKLPTRSPNYLELYYYYTNPNNHLLGFNHHQELGNAWALAYPIYYPKYKPYFLINRQYNIIDLMSIAHEIAHGISYIPNSTNGNCIRIKELTELEGHWFNFLALEYAKKELQFDDLDNNYLNNFITIYDDFISLIVTDLTIKSFNENGNVTEQDLKDKLYDNDLILNIDNELLDETFSESPHERMVYFYSYLISTDLEKVYRTDPEKAFWDYEQIQKFKTYEDLKKLSKYDVTCFIDNYKNFNEKVKKMTKIQKNMGN